MTIRKSLLAAGLAGLFASACLFGETALAQRQQPARSNSLVRFQEEKKGEKNPYEIYYGVNSCNNQGCHGGSKPETWILDKDGKQMPLLSTCDEAKTVKEHDRHNVAYEVLTKNLGKRMQANLAKARKDDKYTVTSDPACLACHAVVVTDKDVLEASKRIGFKVEDGVGCAACHGADSRWIANHALMVSAVKFRPLSPKEKEEKYGLINLRDPVRRTELCASCHVGNLKQGKFVTHEMYAAGHPPLPGFEIATFSNEEPRHWKLMRDQPESIQAELKFAKGTQEETLLVLLGGVISFRDTMTLLKEQAKKASEDKDLLDLSNFDCYACHHTLKAPKRDKESEDAKKYKVNWRQDERWVQKGALGKVRGRDWSFQLVRLSAAYLKEKDKGVDLKQLDDALDALRVAMAKPVGGNTEAILKSATDLESQSAKMADAISKNPPRQDDLPKLLESIEKLFVEKGKWLDHDSARQVAWAAEVIRREYKDPKAAPPTDEPLESVFFLRLRKGQEKEVAPNLTQYMEKVDAYHPQRFLDELKKFLTP